MNVDNKEKFYFLKDDIQNYFNNSFFSKIYQKIVIIFKILFGLFITSNITAIYIKTTILCAPIIILLISNKIELK